MKNHPLTLKELNYYLKSSIISFLLKNNLTFLNREREIVFDLIANDGQVNVQNSVAVNEDGVLIIQSWFPILKDFLETNEILNFCNYTNKFLGFFNTFMRESDENEEYNIIFFKNVLNLSSGTVIDSNFWEKVIKSQINNVSIITDFLYFKFPKSKFFLKKDLSSREFESYFLESCQSYIKSIKIIQENQEKIEIKQLSKEEINKKIDEELENYINTEENNNKLKLLVKSLKKLEKEEKS